MRGMTGYSEYDWERGEYLPRLWTDKPVTLGERTQQIKRGREKAVSPIGSQKK